MFKINGFWGFVSATLVLVLVFLLLNNTTNARQLVQTSVRSYGGLLGILQGRTYGGVLR